MRVSTQQMHRQALDQMLEQQSRLSHTQQQLASGQRLLSAAEDPAAAVRAMRIEREMAATDQYQATAEAVRARQTAEEGALAGVTEVLQGVRELMVQGNSDTLTAGDRRTLAETLDRHLEELLGLANTRHGDGEYLFAGFQSTTRPFSHDGAGTFTYHGDAGVRMLEIGPDLRVAGTSSGELFRGVPRGNGYFATEADPGNTGSAFIGAGQVTGAFVPDDYSLELVRTAPDGPLRYEVRDSGGGLVAEGEYVSGAAIRFNGAEVTVTGAAAEGDVFRIEPAGSQDLFSIVHSAAEALRGAGDDPVARARLHSQVDRSLAELDSALEQVLLQRAKVGSRLNLVERQEEANEAFQVASAEALSNARDLDYADAAMRLQTQLASLEAAQRSYLAIQDLSLFRFLP